MDNVAADYIDDKKALPCHSCEKSFKSKQGIPMHTAWPHPNSTDIDKSCAISNTEEVMDKNNRWKR